MKSLVAIRGTVVLTHHLHFFHLWHTPQKLFRGSQKDTTTSLTSKPNSSQSSGEFAGCDGANLINDNPA